jgi:anti-sigma regulatory factor (Ser/Thr protein kinase)
MMAARRTGAAGPRAPKVTERLAATAKAPARARAALVPLRRTLGQPTFANLVMLVSELVTNRVHHANLEPDQPIGLKVIVRPQIVQVGVIDPGVEFGAPDDRIETMAGGLGFRLLNTIADDWGATRQDGLTRVWFELRRSHPPVAWAEMAWTESGRDPDRALGLDRSLPGP